MERAAHLQDLFFLHISQSPYKNFPKEIHFSLLLKALGKEHPSIVPRSRAPMETDTLENRKFSCPCQLSNHDSSNVQSAAYSLYGP
jgi:hypothetical protein